jgi:hypothetical protein
VWRRGPWDALLFHGPPAAFSLVAGVALYGHGAYGSRTRERTKWATPPVLPPSKLAHSVSSSDDGRVQVRVGLARPAILATRAAHAAT